MRDTDRKQYRANLVDAFVNRRMGRRDFMRNAGLLGLGAAAFGAGMRRPFGLGSMPLANAADDLRPSEEVLKWVKDVSGPFKGTTL